jgi:hypothetical protein
MERLFRHIDVRRDGNVFCAGFRHHQMSEAQLNEMFIELLSLIDTDGCRHLVFRIGPPDPEFLYSVFLAKLVALERRLQAAGGALKLVGASEATWSIFEACRLQSLFAFAPDEATAVREFTQTKAEPGQPASE